MSGAHDRTREIVDDARIERKALGYVARYETTRAHLERVLMRFLLKHQGRLEPGDRARVHAMVEAMHGRGLVDDSRFAETRARRLAERGLPRQRIRTALREKGVGEDVIARSIDTSGEDPDEVDRRAAVTFASKRRLGPWRPPAERHAMRERDLARLARAGFSWRIACNVLDAPEPLEAAPPNGAPPGDPDERA